MIERNSTDDVFHANNPVARPKLPRHAAELGLDWFAMINVGDVVVVVNVRAGTTSSGRMPNFLLHIVADSFELRRKNLFEVGQVADPAEVNAHDHLLGLVIVSKTGGEYLRFDTHSRG